MEAYLQVPWCCHASCLGSQNESAGFIHHKTARHVPKHVSISSRHHPNCQINPKKQRLKTNYYILIPPYSLSAGPPAPPSNLFLVHLSTQISPSVCFPRAIENICLLLRVCWTTQTCPRLKPLEQPNSREWKTTLLSTWCSWYLRGMYQGKVWYTIFQPALPQKKPESVATMGLTGENGILMYYFLWWIFVRSLKSSLLSTNLTVNSLKWKLSDIHVCAPNDHLLVSVQLKNSCQIGNFDEIGVNRNL